MANLNSTSKTCSENKKQSDLRKFFLEELGVTGRQFKTLFDNLPLGIALNKMLYSSKGVPVDYILLESNKVYDKFHHFQKNDHKRNNAN